MPRQGSSTSKTFLPTDAPVPFTDGDSTLIASWDCGGQGELPRPVVLIVSVEGTERELPAGVTRYNGDDGDELAPEGEGGRLVLKYGAGAASKTITMDVKSGSYQLPPIEAARLEVSAWSAPNAGRTVEMKVSAAFVEGVLPATPARPVFSYRVTAIANHASNNRALPVPAGARWVHLTTTLDQEYGPPIVKLYAPGVLVVQDWDATAFVPPSFGPFELGLGRDSYADVARLYNTANGTTANCVVRFYLEL